MKSKESKGFFKSQLIEDIEEACDFYLTYREDGERGTVGILNEILEIQFIVPIKAFKKLTASEKDYRGVFFMSNPRNPEMLGHTVTEFQVSMNDEYEEDMINIRHREQKLTFIVPRQDIFDLIGITD